MVKTMPRVRRRLRYASCLAPCGKTISASIFTICISTSPAFSICRSITFSVCSCCFRQLFLGTITLGLMTQITNVFGQVRGAFQYLINSWTTLVELMSIYKRLRSFEHELDGDKIQEVTHTLS